jgi:thymidylate synthase (FAD)
VSLGKRIESLEEKDIKLIEYLLRHKHWSPFEHCQLTFLVKCPLYVRSQWMRHKSWSFNEISGRYVEIKPEFYIPKQFRKQAESNRQASIDEFLDKNGMIKLSMSSDSYPLSEDDYPYVIENTLGNTYTFMVESCFIAYKAMLAAGVCREQARGVLPQATYTEFYATCSLRSLLHFIDLRIDKASQFEMTQFAAGLVELVKPVFPVALECWEKVKL